MNKIKILKYTDEKISYQKAWNVICEYMNNQSELTFHISPWSDDYGHTVNYKYTLQSNIDKKNKNHFVADKNWEYDKKVK
jgi:hypothetical protein